MSESAETEFDLEKLFLPAWAQESPGTNKYAGFTGDTRREGRSDDRGPRRGPPRPGGNGPRPGGGARPPDRRPEGASRGGPSRDGRSGQDRGRRFEPREPSAPPPPPPQINVSILPDNKGVDSLARQIRMTGRAYPLFDIAQLILQKPERQTVRWEVIKDATGKIAQPLYLCAVDESLWLSEDEVVAHLLRQNFDMFYKAEKTATEPPKGTYTFVAQCGMSGQILGPPNYHDYQTKLHKLHTERFSRMPFEDFKARVKIVKDEAIVKKWIEDLSTKTLYNVLNVPEALSLPNMEAVEKHFRETNLPNLVKQVEAHTTSGPAARQVRSAGLQRLLRLAWEEQNRFPLKLASALSQEFASHGLQFFKANRSVTFVSVARPHYLDMEATPVSEGVRRIVEFINATTKCTRKKLIEALVPTSPPPLPAPAPADGTAPAAPTPPVEPAPSPEMTALSGDLHWLVHQGHVIEFANGILETAKKPLPKPPPKPQPKATETAPAAAVLTEAATEAVSEAGAPEAPLAASQPAATPETPAPSAAPNPEPAAETPAAPPASGSTTPP
jgi:hypothetical protein